MCGAIPAAHTRMEQQGQARIESLTAGVIGCAIQVHRTLGPGLLESVYRECMLIEMRASGLRVERERRVSLKYRGQLIPSGLTMDLVVEECVVVELKAVEQIHSVHIPGSHLLEADGVSSRPPHELQCHESEIWSPAARPSRAVRQEALTIAVPAPIACPASQQDRLCLRASELLLS